ncbi:FAD-dependent monooxygenase [Glycomyces algeriensis]|uniref:FAD-binding domain-containing protein n=1 Tax=Glycomyces algeriensis TaxID=256037 RepID=A0A9W6LIY4_9ACTN|nr:FAD-dependent monooxygenase [Glycomyces algeriensis]MDA1366818.1 FAD-dependent monooxygenase [Glycomyces algeriensis]MDA1368669.1 FAD-dependent monooxygenase [Glycomyces algeriensis]MDR7351706.1 3-(3-hydroxy-phenyl)propionate hydroxylase [Glycomyces algeriensis]GLI44429.1 hypothetical protein GALLR39Z86_42790 [Glycomyces algeriensis]
MTAQGPTSDSDRVLVVGAGPTGLTAACELLRHGIDVRLIDRNPEPSPFPKALLLWPRSLDLLADNGVLGQAREAGLAINAFSYFSDGKPLATFEFPEDLAPLCLPQCDTERVLTERLHALGGRIERGVRLLAFDDLTHSDDLSRTTGLTSILEHSDGSFERFRAPFVLGTDGAGSAVRAQMGSAFTGATYESAFALVDAYIEGDLPTDKALYYQSRAGALVIVALPGGVFRFFSSLRPGERVNVPAMQRIVDEQGPQGVKIGTTVWETTFRVHRRHAEAFRQGRAFIAGDAAHVHSPAGGQGLNTGIQDAHNLAWKIAAVLKGEAPPELLNTYESERKAVARQVVRDTDVQTRGWMLKGRLQVAARDGAFRLLDRTGVIARHYLPVMAGRRLRYPPVRSTQSPASEHRCRRGSIRPGETPGRDQMIAAGVPSPLSGWYLACFANGDEAWAESVQAAAAAWPQITFDSLAGAPWACGRRAYYLFRPDGHVAAHGHIGDLDRLEAELTANFTKAVALEMDRSA